MATQISQPSAFLIYQQFGVCSKPWIDGSKIHATAGMRLSTVHLAFAVATATAMKGNTA